jgi:hypothetical protein
LWLTLLSLQVNANSDAYITLQIDSSEVFNGDTVVLDVESTGLLDPIDLSVIEQSADIIRETTGTRIAVIGGKVQEIAIRRMDLLPKRTGVVVIGPLIAGDIISNSVYLNVLDATRPDWTPLADDAQIKVSLTPDTVYVNQKVLFKLELLHRYPINSESVELPSFDGFAKRPLVESRRTFAGSDNEWFRTEWQILLFPQHSGELPIKAVEWSGTLAKSNIERAAFSRSNSPLTINVEGAPGDSGDWWLPAKSVRLSESWSSPPTELSAGDELERTVTLTAMDVTAGQLPSPQVPESRALKQQLLNTNRKETLTTNGITSTASFTYRVTAQSPIPVFLDTVRVKWWNTDENTPREAIIPARRINVGLPDRADVLSRLALEESRVSQLKHRLQSLGLIRLMSYVAGSMAMLCLLWWYLPSLWRAIHQRLILRNHLRLLKQLARRGDAVNLYQTLQTAQSIKLLDGSATGLIVQLEDSLFRADSKARQAHSPMLPLNDWLAPVLKEARGINSKVKKFQQPQLAEL